MYKMMFDEMAKFNGLTPPETSSDHLKVFQIMMDDIKGKKGGWELDTKLLNETIDALKDKGDKDQAEVKALKTLMLGLMGGSNIPKETRFTVTKIARLFGVELISSKGKPYIHVNTSVQ